MRARVVAGLWLVAGVIIWNAFFDLYVSRGAREYLQKKAEYDAGLGPWVVMDVVMLQATRDGLIMSSVWSGLIVAGGWATIWAVRRTQHPAPRTSTRTQH